MHFISFYLAIVTLIIIWNHFVEGTIGNVRQIFVNNFQFFNKYLHTMTSCISSIFRSQTAKQVLWFGWFKWMNSTNCKKDSTIFRTFSSKSNWLVYLYSRKIQKPLIGFAWHLNWPHTVHFRRKIWQHYSMDTRSVGNVRHTRCIHLIWVLVCDVLSSQNAALLVSLSLSFNLYSQHQRDCSHLRSHWCVCVIRYVFSAHRKKITCLLIKPISAGPLTTPT